MKPLGTQYGRGCAPVDLLPFLSHIVPRVVDLMQYQEVGRLHPEKTRIGILFITSVVRIWP